MVEEVAAVLGVYVATLVAGAVSGFLPIINSELYLIGAIVVTGYDLSRALALVVCLTVGMCAAKAVLYHLSARVSDIGQGGESRFAKRVAAARAKAVKWESKPLTVSFLAASVGLPPFYIMALAAGVLRIPFLAFIGISVVGRLIRFGVIAVVVVYV